MILVPLKGWNGRRLIPNLPYYHFYIEIIINYETIKRDCVIAKSYYISRSLIIVLTKF